MSNRVRRRLKCASSGPAQGTKIHVLLVRLNLYVSNTDMSLSFQPTQDALKNLEEALNIQSPSDLERDGTVQRFEYSYEALWKLAQKVLQEHEVRAEFPKAVFRELGRLGWINNVEEWLEFQQARNDSSLEYGIKYATTSYKLAKVFLPLAQQLFTELKLRNNE